MKALYDLKEILEKEVEAVVKKGGVTTQDLDNMYKVVDIVKDIETICAMSEHEDYYDGESHGGYSYAKRNSMGRYSREAATDRMVKRLTSMLDAAPTDRERMILRECIDRLDH